MVRLEPILDSLGDPIEPAQTIRHAVDRVEPPDLTRGQPQPCRAFGHPELAGTVDRHDQR
jgi:hypothetical protein